MIRGEAPVLGWAPQTVPTAGDDLARRVLDLYGQRDPGLATCSRRRDSSRDRMAGPDAGKKPAGGADTPQGMRQAAEGAARLLAADDGPRIAALAFDGWDTHVNEGGATGRLARLLGGLDGAIEAFETGLGRPGPTRSIVVVTEFGRTAHINGTIGTDHGTGTVAFLAGGAVQGRPGHRGLAGPQARPALRGPRPPADDRPALAVEGRARDAMGRVATRILAELGVSRLAGIIPRQALRPEAARADQLRKAGSARSAWWVAVGAETT